ncbi:hypothetical protein EV182_003312, partial [Spiromyces aspiralis]
MPATSPHPTIRHLPFETREALRSGFAVPTFVACCTRLVENSIDAGATSVQVDVYGATAIKVTDNGCGIREEDLAKLGQRYMTSKIRSVSDLCRLDDTLGFRGEALASIARMSELEIITKPAGENCWRARILLCRQAGDAAPATQITVHPYSPFAVTGTIAIVREIYRNYPVRQRELHTNVRKEVEALVRTLETLMLVHPAISVRLRVGSEAKTVRLNLPRVSTTYQRFGQIYGNVLGRDLDYVAIDWEGMELEGCITRSPVFKGGCQFIYIGKRQLVMDEIYALVNSVFGTSKYLKRESDCVLSKVAKRNSARYPAYIL